VKIALSTNLFPNTDADELLARAKSWRCDGLELSGLYGHVDLGPAAAAARDPAGFRAKVEAAGLAVCALDSELTIGALPHHALGAALDRGREALSLARLLGAAAVIVHGAPRHPGIRLDAQISQCAEAANRLGRDAEKAGVILAVETTGILARSENAWFVRDAADSDSVRICLNPAAARLAGDAPSVALKRLAGTLAVVRVAATEPGDQPSAARGGDLPLLIELLKGVVYCGWITLGAAVPGRSAGAQADAFVAEFAAGIREVLERPPVELTAYKGDKNAPRFRPRAGGVARGCA
jgi:sugar phosphate isomerase/epimerase